MIDFDALVLGPCQEAFARPITITPLASQPGQPAYGARGIWSARPVNIGLEEGSVMVSQDLTLGIRRNELAVMIKQGDSIEIDAYMSLPRVGVCDIDRLNLDGQGDVQLVLKVITP